MSRTAYELWEEIRRITGAGGLFVVKVQERTGYDALRRPLYGDAYVLYRGQPGKPGAARLGRRRDPGALLRLIKRFALSGAALMRSKPAPRPPMQSVCAECLLALREQLERKELRALEYGFATVCPARNCACGARAEYVAIADQ